MSWNQWYRISSYIKSALWVAPFVAMLLEQVTLRLAFLIDKQTGWSLLELTQPEAQAILQAIITMTLSFIVFTFGSLLVAVQIAGGQLTPRIIATTLLRDNAVKYSVGLFVFTLLFAIGVAGRTDTTVYQFVVFVAAILGFSCIATFLYLIDYAARLLRPASIVGRVGQSGLAVIESVFPHPVTHSPAPEPDWPLGTPDRIILHQNPSGIVLAVNLRMRCEPRRQDGMASSNSCRKSEILLARTSRCSDCMAAPAGPKRTG